MIRPPPPLETESGELVVNGNAMPGPGPGPGEPGHSAAQSGEASPHGEPGGSSYTRQREARFNHTKSLFHGWQAHVFAFLDARGFLEVDSDASDDESEDVRCVALLGFVCSFIFRQLLSFYAFQ